MKKKLLILSVIVVIVSIFVSCSANSREEVSTTAVTDSNGTAHYYEPVTDDHGNVSTTAENQGVYAEIETKSNGKAVTDKNGAYVTKEHTTVLPITNEISKPSSSAESAPEKSSGTTRHNDDTQADNNIEFEPDKPTEETKPTASTTAEKPATNTTETTIQKETQPATDKDGWITKWY